MYPGGIKVENRLKMGEVSLNVNTRKQLKYGKVGHEMGEILASVEMMFNTGALSRLEIEVNILHKSPLRFENIFFKKSIP